MGFLTHLVRYLNFLKALVFREGALRKLHPVESLLGLLEPVLLIATLTIIMSFLGRRQVSPLGGHPILFYTTGFFALYLFLYISRRIRIPPMGRGRFPVEQRLDHLIVHVMLRILEYTILGFFLFGIVYAFFTELGMPRDVTPIFTSCAAIVGLGFGWATLNQSITKIFRKGSRIWPFAFGIVSRSLIIFSGVIFVPDFMTPDIRYYLSFNPLLHAVALFRMAFYPQYPTLIFDSTYLVFSTLVVILIGLIIERLTRRQEA